MTSDDVKFVALAIAKANHHPEADAWAQSVVDAAFPPAAPAAPVTDIPEQPVEG